MHFKVSPAERQLVVRHLLARCPQCLAITGRLFNTGGKGILDLKTALEETPPPAPDLRRAQWPRSEGRPAERQAAVAAIVSAAQDLLLTMVEELERFHDRLQSAFRTLPSPKHADSATADVLMELRNVIGCVLEERIGPALTDLRDAALYPNELPAGAEEEAGT